MKSNKSHKNVHIHMGISQSIYAYILPVSSFHQLGTFLNTMKRILDVLHCRVEDILKSWASVLPVMGDKKFGEQMNGTTVLLRTKYKNYLQATVGKLVSNVSVVNKTKQVVPLAQVCDL